MNKNWWYVLVVILVVAAVAGAVLLGRGAEKEENGAVTSSITTEEPSRGDEDGDSDTGDGEVAEDVTVVIFHNGTGPMCLEALDFFKENGIGYEEHLTMESDFSQLLSSYKSQYPVSEGVSTSYGYYPMMFVGGRAFSGFDSEIQQEIFEMVSE